MEKDGKNWIDYWKMLSYHDGAQCKNHNGAEFSQPLKKKRRGWNLENDSLWWAPIRNFSLWDWCFLGEFQMVQPVLPAEILRVCWVVACQGPQWCLVKSSLGHLGSVNKEQYQFHMPWGKGASWSSLNVFNFKSLTICCCCNPPYSRNCQTT